MFCILTILQKKGRGVAMYIRDDLYCNQLYVDSVYKDFVLLQLKFGANERLITGNFYRSPNSSIYLILIRSVLLGKININCGKMQAIII